MKRSIGIVGGAGPIAGALLLGQIIQICQEKYGCKEDQDFPLIKLISFPFDQMLTDSPSAKVAMQLQGILETFDKDGIELVSVACNTLHGFLPNLDQYEFEFVSIIDDTQRDALILCTSTSRRNQVYQGIYPGIDIQAEVDAIIDRVLTGAVLEKDAGRIIEIIKPYKHYILGCTELSVINEKYPLKGGVIDPLKILAEHLSSKALNRQNCIS